MVDNILENLLTPQSPTLFKQVLGAISKQDYYDFLAQLNQMSETSHTVTFFEETIPKPVDTDLIQAILGELKTMHVGNFRNEDINLTPSASLNQLIRESFDKILPTVIPLGKFSSDSMRNNFIAKMMIWCNQFLEEVEDIKKHYFIFYGTPKLHEIFFLALLHNIGSTVLILTPSGQALDIAPALQIQQEQVGPLTFQESLQDCIAKGVVIEKVTTFAKQASHELENTLYSGSGIYKPWQFSSGNTYPVQLDSVVEDLLTYWNEEARMRPGFKTKGKTVHVPTFFTKVDGVYRDHNEYFKLVQKIREAKHILYFRSFEDFNMHKSREVISPQEIFTLAYFYESNGKLKREEVKKHKLYAPFKVLRGDLQEFILSKIEETVGLIQKGFLQTPPTNKEAVQLLAIVLNLGDKFIRLIENFDFTSHIPKIVIYESGVPQVEPFMVLLIAFLRQIGCDIVILSPSGTETLEQCVTERFLARIRLEEFERNFILEQPKKESFFKRLFR